MRFISLLQASLLVVPMVSSAQSVAITDWPPASGSRVRILSPALGDKKQEAIVISARPDTLFFRQSGQSVERSLLTSQIAGIEIANGTRTRKGKGALVGFIVGAGLGAALAAATYKEPKGFAIDFGRGGDAALAGAFCGLLGAGIGALVGMQSTDKWVPLSVPSH